jgi:hypothetical protein
MAKIRPKEGRAGQRWRVSVLTRSLRLFHGAGMNGLLAICGICREIMS